jgi:hypothetical protein
MLGQRRFLAAVITALVAFEWVVAAEQMTGGLMAVLRFVVPAALLSLAVAWLFFTFAGRLFTWPRAFRSVLGGTGVVTPLLALYYSASKDETLITQFLFMIAVGWAASLGGIFWNLGSAVGDAFGEWRHEKQSASRRTLSATA